MLNTILFFLLSFCFLLPASYAQYSFADTTTANNLFNRAKQLHKDAALDSSYSCFLNASQIYEAIGTNYNDLNAWSKFVNCYNYISDIYRTRGQITNAIAYLNKALDICERKLGEDNLAVAECYNAYGIIHSIKGEPDKALDYYNKSVAIRIKLLGENDAELAANYNNIGIIYALKGIYDQAMEYYHKSLTIRIKIFGEHHPDVASCYSNMGIIYYDKGDYDQALELYHNALSIRLETLPPDHDDIAISYNNIGLTSKEKGNFEGALENFNKAADIWRKKYGINYSRLAAIFNNIGLVYVEKGDFDKALEMHNKSLSIKVQTLGPSHNSVASTYNNIGNLYFKKTEYDKALEFYNKSLIIRINSLGNNHLSVASNYNNLGTVYEKKGEYDKALEYYQKSLKIRLNEVGEDNILVTSNYMNIGNVYNALEKWETASEYYQKDLAISLKILGRKHPEVAGTLLGIGDFYYNQRNYRKAADYYQQAIIALMPDFEDSSIYVNPSLKHIISETHLLLALKAKVLALEKLYAVTSNDRNDLEMSLSTCFLIVDLVDLMRKSYREEGSKLFWGQTAAQLYAKSIQIALQLYQLTNNEKYKEAAFFFAEKSKAGILLESVFDTNAKRFAGIEDTLLKKEKQLKIDLTSYKNNLSAELLEGNNADSSKIIFWQDKIFNLKQEYEKVMQQLETQYPDYYKLKYQHNTVSVRNIQDQLLDDQTALIEYVNSDSAIYIFALSQNDFKIVSVGIDSSFDETVRSLRAAIIQKNYENYIQCAYKLYQQLIEPIKDDLLCSKLIIIPDGISGYIPFEALIGQKMSESKDNYTKLSYLINNYSIGYGYSATLLFENRHKEQLRYKNDYVAFAPIFSRKSKTGYIARSHAILAGVEHSGATRSMVQNSRNIFPLPMTETETMTICELFNRTNKQAKVFTYHQASEENLKSFDLLDYKYIHFATHGFVNEAEPALSGIFLAQNDSSKEDGILYSGEIYNLQLNADMVVLSACETALGKVVNGEGIIGLTRGFLYAGANSLVVSLWRVEDLSTSKLMVDLYKNLLDDKDKSCSLRLAKLNLIKNRRTAAPYFWAPFIIIGS